MATISIVAAAHPRLAPASEGIRILRNDAGNRRRVWCQSGGNSDGALNPNNRDRVPNRKDRDRSPNTKDRDRALKPKNRDGAANAKNGDEAPNSKDGDRVPNRSGKVFIFGMGYTALALANTLQKRGWEVAGTCRSEEKRTALQQRGFRAHLFNDDERLREDAVQELHKSTHIVSSIPPVGDFDRDPVLASLREQELAHAQWIGYLSSTSVYGDWQGGWVDEATEPRPADAKAAARREAERRWLRLGEVAGVCVHVFRLGGIYGPRRSALDAVARERLSATQRARAHKRFTSRVHVADICQVVVKAMEGERASGVFNVVDDDPSPRGEVMAYARQLLQRERPVEEEVELGFGSSRVAEKRVSNRRVKEELRVELLYPSFRSGLAAIVSGSDDPFD